MTDLEKLSAIILLSAATGLVISCILWLRRRDSTTGISPDARRHHWLIRRWCYHDGRYFAELHDGRLVQSRTGIAWNTWPSGESAFSVWNSYENQLALENFMLNAAPLWRDKIRSSPEGMGITRPPGDDDGHPQ